MIFLFFCFFFSSRRRHTRFKCDWSADVCSSDLRERGRLWDAAEREHAGVQPEADDRLQRRRRREREIDALGDGERLAPFRGAEDVGDHAALEHAADDALTLADEMARWAAVRL